MQIFLPIAEVSVNAYALVGIGGVVGFLSGLFGVGGGFLITPLLFFIGVPPAVAVATGANQVVASSISGVLAQLKRKAVDFRMGAVLLAGGLIGSSIGIWIFARLNELGKVDAFVQLSYVIFLGTVGLIMLQESVRAIWRARRHGITVIRRAHVHTWVHGMPLKMKFRASGLYISVIPPMAIGAFVGFLSAIMGVGGGFIMVPAMIYLLGMPTKVVIGTSLFQIIFTTAFTTVMHAVSSQSVDLLLALLLILGGVIGAQLGARMGVKLKAEYLRLMLAVLVLLVCGRVALDLVLTPSEFYSITPGKLP